MLDQLLEELGYSSRKEFYASMVKMACEAMALISLAIGAFVIAFIYGGK